MFVADHRRIDYTWPLSEALAGADLLAANGRHIAAYRAEGGGIRILDAIDGVAIGPAAAVEPFAGEPISRLALSEDSLVACSRANLCAAWPLTAGAPLGEPLMAQFETSVQDLHLDAACGCAVVAAFTSLWRWSLRTGERAQLYQGGPIFASGVLPGGRAYASITDVEIVDLMTGAALGTLRHRGEVQGGVAALGDTGMLVTFGTEGIGRLWDVDAFVEAARFRIPDGYPHAIKPIGDARRFALVSGADVEIWDLTSAWLDEGVCTGVVGETPPGFWQRLGLAEPMTSRC